MRPKTQPRREESQFEWGGAQELITCASFFWVPALSLPNSPFSPV